MPKKKAVSDKRRRRTSYDPGMVQKVGHWARDGLIDEEIAVRLGIAIGTLYEWKKRYPEFKEAINNGKAEVDYLVEDSLLRRALGYKVDEVTKELGIVFENGDVKRDADGNPLRELQVSKVVTKEVAPDVAAQIFWLKNRQSGKWRDKQQIEHSGGPVTFINDLPPDEDNEQ